MLYINTPYLWGGKTPFGIDCSGYSQMVYMLNGIRLNRDASQQAKQGKIVQLNINSKAGDLAFFQNKSGNIIGISSVVATSGNPGQSNYVAAKSGMIGFYKSIALEVASRNINVNIVSPGFIISPMTNKLNDKQKNLILEKIPMKRFGSSNEIADLVYFLSSDESKYITGQNIHINGGMLMV